MVAEIVIKMAQTKLFQKIEDVLCKHIIRFGKKKTMDVRNRVETTGQLKIKTKASRKFQRRYQKCVDSLTSDDWDFTSDWESDSESSDTDISLANNASETEQNLSDNKLIIDIKTEQNLTPSPESLANNITEYKVSTSNNSESFNETSETADNK